MIIHGSQLLENRAMPNGIYNNYYLVTSSIYVSTIPGKCINVKYSLISNAFFDMKCRVV